MLRAMTDQDVDYVSLVVSRALAAEEGRPIPTQVNNERARGNWARRLPDPSHWAIVALDAERIVGICHGEPERDSRTGELVTGAGHLTGLFVDPDSWGRGHGRELLREGLAQLRNRGYERAFLWSAADNDRANGLYESEGWRRTGQRRVGLDGREEAQYETRLERPA